jgi:hypothetical protein
MDRLGARIRFRCGAVACRIYLRTTDRTSGVEVVVVIVVVSMAKRMAQVEPMQRRSVKQPPE